MRTMHVLALAAVVGVGAVSAQADTTYTIDFENVTSPAPADGTAIPDGYGNVDDVTITYNGDLKVWGAAHSGGYTSGSSTFTGYVAYAGGALTPATMTLSVPAGKMIHIDGFDTGYGSDNTATSDLSFFLNGSPTAAGTITLTNAIADASTPLDVSGDNFEGQTVELSLEDQHSSDRAIDNLKFTVSPVPEPTALDSLALGGGLLLLVTRRKRKLA